MRDQTSCSNGKQSLRQQPGLDWTSMNLKVILNIFSHGKIDDNKSLHIYNTFPSTSCKLSPGLFEITYIFDLYIIVCKLA